MESSKKKKSANILSKVIGWRCQVDVHGLGRGDELNFGLIIFLFLRPRKEIEERNKPQPDLDMSYLFIPLFFLFIVGTMGG